MGFSGMELESRCDAIIVKRTRSDPSPLRGGVGVPTEEREVWMRRSFGATGSCPPNPSPQRGRGAHRGCFTVIDSHAAQRKNQIMTSAEAKEENIRAQTSIVRA